jgi:hypothetical protein
MYGALIEIDGTTLIASSARLPRAGRRPRQGGGVAVPARVPPRSVTVAHRSSARWSRIDELPSRSGAAPWAARSATSAATAHSTWRSIQLGDRAGQLLHIRVGGAIVADSDAAAALAETDREAAGWIAALDRLAQRRAPPGP